MEDKIQEKINALMGEATELQRRLAEYDKARDEMIQRLIEIRGAVRELNGMKEKPEAPAETPVATEPKA